MAVWHIRALEKQDIIDENIIEANATISNIEYEFNKIYNYVRDIYTVRFPELETLIAKKLDYIKAAGNIKNDLDTAKQNLSDKLPDATVMIVAMTASNSQGKKLDSNKIELIVEASRLADIGKGFLKHFLPLRVLKISKLVKF